MVVKNIIAEDMPFTKSIFEQFWRSYCKKMIFVVFHFLKFLPIVNCCLRWKCRLNRELFPWVYQLPKEMSIRPQSSWELMNYIWIDSTEFNTIFYSLHYFLTCQCTTTVFNNIYLGPPWDYADLPAAMWLLFAGLDMWLIKSDNCAFTQQSAIAAIHWYQSHFLLVLEI